MDRLEYGYSDLEEAICFFENEIKQYEVAMNGILSKGYREYLNKKTKHYKVATDAIRELFYE